MKQHTAPRLRMLLPLTVALSLIMAILSPLPSAFAAVAPIYVLQTGGDDLNCDGTVNVAYSSGPACAKATIQAGVNAVAPDGTVNVAAGTYIEQVVIDSKNVTLTGAGSGTTFIQAPAVLTNDPDGAKTLVLFTGAITAEFSGFTVRGPVTGLNFGIYVRAGATANIHNNVIKDIRDEPLSGTQIGVAIEVGKYNDTAPRVNETGTATITNNTINGYQKTGIAVERTGSSATITGNTITGAGPITTTAQNGIQIRRGATGTVQTNTVTGNAYINPTCGPWDGVPTFCWSAEGIGVLHAGSGVIVQGNSVNHNNSNIYSWKSDGIQVLNNQVSDSVTDPFNSAGITVQSDGTPSCCGGSTGNYVTGVTISGNTVQNNLSGGSTQGDGINLYAVNGATVSGNTITGTYQDGILVGGSGNTTFTNNQFSGNGLLSADPNAAAIDFGGQQGHQGDLNPLGGFTVHNNVFTGNRNAIWNYDSGVVDATNNWWGNVSGPGSLTNITATPWCTDVACVTKSDNADLTSLSLSSGTLVPTFSSGTISYTAGVDSSVTSVTVSQTAAPGAAVVVSGTSLSPGNNSVTVAVTSADGTVTETYTVTVRRAVTLYVDTTGSDSSNDCLSSGSPCQTISGAIAKASSGDIINVAAGSYTEQINIMKPLTLTGAGQDTTHINTPDPLTMTIYDAFGSQSSTPRYIGHRAADIPVVRIASSDVTFQGFDVNLGNKAFWDVKGSFGTLYSRSTGILVDHVETVPGTPDVFTNIKIQNNKVDGMLAGDKGDDIKTLGNATVTIQSNTIYAYGESGISAIGSEDFPSFSPAYHPTVTAISNTIYGGSGARPGTNYFFGIGYWVGATGTADGNTIYNAPNDSGNALNSWTTTPVSFTHNTITTDGGSVGGVGAQLYQSHALIFSNNTIENQGLAGAIWSNPTITISGNTVTNSTDGFLVDGQTSGSVKINNNSISGIPAGHHAVIVGGTSGADSGTIWATWGGPSSVVVDATNNWWGSAVASTVAAGIVGNVTSTPYYVDSGLSHLNTDVPSAVYVGASYTDGSAGGHSFSWDAFTTIQAGMNAVASGGTVNVAAGIYTEQISISKSLTLAGAGSGTTIIQAPAVLTNDPDGAKTLVLFTGPITAEFSGFTVQGPVTGLNFGIYVRAGATANIHNNTVKDIRGEPFGSGNSQYGYAIEVGKYNDTFPNVSQTGHATITNNDIIGYQKTGIESEGTGSSATITGNTVTGAGPTTITAQNGIQIRRGATGSIINNVVTGNAYNGPSVSAFGIGVTNAGSGVVIQGNTTHGNGANVYCFGSDAVQILGNQVSNSYSGDAWAYAGIVVLASGASAPLNGITVSDNTVQNNLSSGSKTDGIDLYNYINSATVSNNIITGHAYDGLWIGSSNGSNITVTGNQFSGNGLSGDDPNAAAIDLGHWYPNTSGGFSIHDNSFVGNRNAIWNYDTSTVVATNNWWGNVSGPGSLTNITTTPWCTDVACVAKSDNADLTSLSLSSGTLSPVFSSSATAYSASVAASVRSVTVTKSTNPGASAVVSGGSNLSVGSNTVSVTVTSADGTAIKTYTITVTRAAAPPPPPAPPSPPTASVEVPVTQLATSTKESKVEASIEVAGAPSLAVAVTVPIGAVSQDVTVSIAPAVTSAEAATGVVSIKVSITDAAGAPVTHFDKPLTLSLGKPAADTTAAYSQDGLVWTVIVKLDGTTLPAGVHEGYYVAADGSLVILTDHLTYFGMKKTQAPLVLTANATRIPLGGFAALSVTGGSGSGAGAYVTSTAAICAVDEHGIVTALKAGTCTVSATKTGDGTYLNISSSPLELTFVDLTPPAAPPTRVAKTVKVSGSGLSRLIQVNLGAAFGGKKVTIQIRKARTTTYKTLCVVTLNKAGMVRTTRWLVLRGATIRVLVGGKSLVATIVR